MKIKLKLFFLDILCLVLLSYGIYRYVSAITNYKVLFIWIGIMLFAHVFNEHRKLYKNQKRVY